MAVGPRADLVDGIEIYNACNLPGEDLPALRLGNSGNYIQTSGGDIHYAGDDRIGSAGVLLPWRVHDEKEFAQALRQNAHHLRIDGKNIKTVLESHLK